MDIARHEKTQALTIYRTSGVKAAQAYLKSQGYSLSQKAIRDEFDRIVANTTQTVIDTPMSDCLSSADMLKAVAYEQAACCERLKTIAKATHSYRVEAVLSEALGRLHQQLVDVDF